MQMKKFNTLRIFTLLIIGVGLFFYLNPKVNPKYSENTTLNRATQNVTSVAIPKNTPLSILTKNAPFKANISQNQLTQTISTLENEEEEDMKGLSPAQRLSKQQRIKEALEHEFDITKDPALGYVPIERKRAAILQTKRMQADMVAKSSFERGSSIQKTRWIPRGPGNVGGRTLAIQCSQVVLQEVYSKQLI
jgi:hypothetical protein